MVVLLDPKSLGGKKKVSLTTTSQNKINRAKRVQEDLDKFFIEGEMKARAKYLKMEYIDLYGFPIDTSHLILLNREEAIEGLIGIFSLKDKAMILATPDPSHPGQTEIIQKLESQGYTTSVYLCSYLSFNKLIKTYDAVVDTRRETDDINISQDLLDKLAQEGVKLDNLEKLIKGLSVTEIVEFILAAAVQNGASDIHFEPEENTYNLRLRLDGVLHTFAHLDNANKKSIENRLKIISSLKINISNIPQDGRFSFRAGGRDIDVRVSMLPSTYGYSVVMRLLGTGNVALELSALGFSGLAKERVMDAVNRPQGLILTTGPTGSGKTTTLYTFLQDLNDGESKIITLEDPIEYKLAGISQTQIDSSGGYTFASGLRSILRQDPDVVMVGEIRDPETAEISVQASLTGHKVLSTIHTNDAAGAIPRMMEMKIRGFLLADSLAVIIGQRLIRRLCPHCKHPTTLSEKEQGIVYDQINKIPTNSGIQITQDLQFYTADGCPECNGLGYKGRIGVYEVMSITLGLRNLLSEKYPSIQDVRAVATEEGMVSMFQDGLIKCLEGVTDLKELMDVVDFQ